MLSFALYGEIVKANHGVYKLHVYKSVIHTAYTYPTGGKHAFSLKVSHGDEMSNCQRFLYIPINQRYLELGLLRKQNLFSNK